MLLRTSSRAAILMLCFASSHAALAQATSGTPSAPSDSVTATDTVEETPATAGYGDIVVTAQRRSERLRDVPISITAVTGDALAQAGVANVRELGNLVPGLTFTTQGTFAQPTIRGVQSSISVTGSENPISIYIDGFYQPNQVANIFDLPDVSRVEVLKGPQGTLFGRNATGGAITIYTRDPSFVPTGDIVVSDGVFSGGGSHRSNEFTAKAFLSAPLVEDVLAVSVSGYYDKIDGYLVDDRTGRGTGEVESYAVRGKLLFKPAPGLRFILAGFADHRHDDAAASAAPLRGNTNAQFYPPFLISTKPYHLASELKDSVVPTRSEHRGATLRAEFDFLDAGKLTSLTGYTFADSVTTSDIDGAYAPTCPFPRCLLYNVNYGPSRTFQQELSFASEKFGALSFVAGLFYYHDRSDSTTNLNPPLNPDGSLVDGGVGLVRSAATVRTRSYAAFGEATLDVTDRLHLIGGLRYSVDKKSGVGKRGVAGVPFAFGGLPTSHRWTPRFSARFDITDVANIYATYSKGFKSGVIDAQGFTNSPALPETISSYEVGTKIGGPRYSFTAAAFLYDYSNLQVQFFNGTRTLLGNAATARIIGLDIDASAEVAEGLQLRVAGSWLPKAEYRNFPGAVAFLLPNKPTGMAQTVIDASGHRILKSARLGGSISANYSRTIGLGLLEANATLAYSSGYNWELTDRVKTVRHAILNGQLALTPSDSDVRIALFGKNLTGQHVISGTLLAAQIDGVEYTPPRQIGVSVGYHF
ncbi:TonB-dependent receptor [Novosphingobium tardum]|uniref:TonB-dependent receptor n=1 Tax=Novosphingobium tardum TaxID=1538021 RepID=A0ABV8RSR9_9SPHN